MKQISHLQLIQKISECVDVGCVTSGVGVWSLSVLKLLQHSSVHQKHFNLHHRHLSVNPKRFSLYHKYSSVCCKHVSMRLDCIQTAEIRPNWTQSWRVNSIPYLPTHSACYIAYTVCPTRYRTRNFFNNFTTNANIATKFEADLPNCVRNVTTSKHVLKVATICVQTGLKSARHVSESPCQYVRCHCLNFFGDVCFQGVCGSWFVLVNSPFQTSP